MMHNFGVLSWGGGGSFSQPNFSPPPQTNQNSTDDNIGVQLYVTGIYSSLLFLWGNVWGNVGGKRPSPPKDIPHKLHKSKLVVNIVYL